MKTQHRQMEASLTAASSWTFFFSLIRRSDEAGEDQGKLAASLIGSIIAHTYFPAAGLQPILLSSSSSHAETTVSASHTGDAQPCSGGMTSPAATDCFICSSNLICPGPACLIQWACETVMGLNYLSRADDTDAAYLLGLPTQEFSSRNVP